MSTLASLLDQGLRVRPDSIAVKMAANGLSFKELDLLSNALAAKLQREFGVEPADRVIVSAQKGLEIVIAAFAIWKCGAIYVPVDANNPPVRLQHILRTIQPAVIVAPQRDFDPSLANATKLAAVITYPEFQSLTPLARDELTFRATPDAPAMIIHTSGSTGLPKGAVLSHASVLQYFHDHNEYLKFGTASRGMNNGPFHFDVSIQDTFLPLYFGSTVLLHSNLFASSVMVNLLIRNEITHLIAVSSVLELISQDLTKFEQLASSALQVVVTGGEVCDPKLINRWLDTIPGVRVLYGYGPTECNSLCMTHEILRPEPHRTIPYPIGKPFRRMEAVLLDERTTPIDTAGVTGVLALAGAQLMTGYWGEPDQTARVLTEIGGKVYYVTGDHCYRDDAGDYHFVGRTDSEVKIRGRRINLNEIRNALLSCERVRHAVVGTVIVDGDPRILSFALVDRVDRGLHDEIERLLAVRVPDYMMPFYIFLSTHAPRTSTTKINEKEIVQAACAIALEKPKQRYFEFLQETDR